MGPKQHQDDPKMMRNGAKMIPKWPRIDFPYCFGTFGRNLHMFALSRMRLLIFALEPPKHHQKFPISPQNDPKMTPEMAQELVPKWHQNGPKSAQNGPKT